MSTHPKVEEVESSFNSLEERRSLIELVDLFRLDASRKTDAQRRAKYGQYFTPAKVARLMASMFEARPSSIRLLDAGAGVGSLTTALVAEAVSWEQPPQEILITAYETDSRLIEYLESSLDACRTECSRNNIRFNSEVLNEDFIEAGTDILAGKLASSGQRSFNQIILNPPYRKINTDSETKELLRTVGIETSNLYTAFISICVALLEQGGELVAITPRSFCNGPYFKAFRKAFLDVMSFRQVHLFESRDLAFQDDQVLQENIIFHTVKTRNRSRNVLIVSSAGAEDEWEKVREVRHDQLVRPEDPDLFIHIVPDDVAHDIARQMMSLTSTLADLGITVSTGRVVDFRAKDHLRMELGNNTVPLIYPVNLRDGFVKWPVKSSRKPQALANHPETESLLVPAGFYVIAKRFSAKEERRRIVAAVYDPASVKAATVGFENHLNYYHQNGGGLTGHVAKGLSMFLNSTVVDSYFRQFSGHTQVNATDLRSLKYPALKELERLGREVGSVFPNQNELDNLVNEIVFNMSEEETSPSMMSAKRKIEEALFIIKELGFPRAQQNERSALTLLSLLDLEPDTSWSKAGTPLRGITQMMDFFAEHYGKRYAPNSRETVRRQTVHQFLDAGIIVANPDKPERPINSGKTVYKIEASALELVRTYGTKEWDKNLRAYLTSVETLKTKYAQERKMNRIPVTMPTGEEFTLSPGGQNILIAEIIKEFCERFTPGGKVIYVGDADEKWMIYDRETFEALGVTVDAHGKMPDVVVHHVEKNWLVLIEAVTSHGPVNPKRRKELKDLFSGSRAGLVFVTAFLDRKTMVRYLDDISWETEVWIAASPDHLIHFNGERFLGPYEES
jgi:adenine-specific DNA-methyltransferase